MDKYIESSPLEEILDEEYHDMVLNFCTYVCILKNKKMNFPSIFVEILKDRDIYEVYLDFCGFDDEREGMREFMKIDDSIVRSKFLKKYINQQN